MRIEIAVAFRFAERENSYRWIRSSFAVQRPGWWAVIDSVTHASPFQVPDE